MPLIPDLSYNYILIMALLLPNHLQSQKRQRSLDSTHKQFEKIQSMLISEISNKLVGPISLNTLTDLQNYPGLCNLCLSSDHLASNCSFSMLFYHATNQHCLDSILKNGFVSKPGRLGKGLYVSDSPLMPILFVKRNPNKFPNPILLKIKAFLDGKIEELKNPLQAEFIKKDYMKNQGIQAFKCPYYTTQNQVLHEFALFKCEYSVVAYSKINIKQAKPKLEKNQAEFTDNINQKNQQNSPQNTLLDGNNALVSSNKRIQEQKSDQKMQNKNKKQGKFFVQKDEKVINKNKKQIQKTRNQKKSSPVQFHIHKG